MLLDYHYLKVRKGKKIWPWVSVALLVLVVFIALVYWGRKQNRYSHENILRMGKVIATTYRINSSMAWVEQLANAYYHSGNPRFKQSIRQADRILDSLMLSAQELTTGYMWQKGQMDSLQILLNKRIAITDSIVLMRDIPANSDYLTFALKELALDSTYHAYYSSVINEGSSILRGSIQDNYSIIRKALLLLFAVGLLTLIILVFIFIRINNIIKKRKKVIDRTLRDREEQYRSLIENARVVMYTTDIEGKFIFVNGRAEAFTGYTAKELLGNSYEMVITPESFPQVKDYYIQQIKLNFPESELEIPIRRKDGSIKWVHQLAVLRYDDDGRIRGFQCIVKDIDEQKKLELNMQEMEEHKKRYQFLLQALMDNSPSLIFVKDIESKYLVINRRFEQIFALAGKDIIGKDDYFFNSAEATRGFHESDQWVLRNKKQRSSVEMVETTDGPRSYMVTKFPLINAEGEVVGVCGIATDISDQINKTRELELARKKAEEAEKAQEHFVAHVSHEIRTPLNGIIGMTNLLKDSALTAEQQDFVKIISSSSETLLYLINDLLDTAKIKAGRLTLEKISFNLGELINKTLPSLIFRAKEKKITLKSDLSPEIPPVIIGDPYRLSQILLNLLGNALKFTHEGSVSLQTLVKSKERKDIWIQFVVEDTGIGIAADKIMTLFKEFSQASTDTSRKYGGTGLGLSITEKLVKLQGGQIEVESEDGKGSRFTICIPYGYEEAEGKEKPNVSDGRLLEVSLKGVNVLIVDDNVINQKVAGKILQNAGANTIFASTGKEAVGYLAHNSSPEVVLMDLMMPEMEGYEATLKIRNELKLQIPIIAMTATTFEEERKRCMEVGMNGYISKPFSARELIRLINGFVGP